MIACIVLPEGATYKETLETRGETMRLSSVHQNKCNIMLLLRDLGKHFYTRYRSLPPLSLRTVGIVYTFTQYRMRHNDHSR